MFVACFADDNIFVDHLTCFVLFVFDKTHTMYNVYALDQL